MAIILLSSTQSVNIIRKPNNSIINFICLFIFLLYFDAVIPCGVSQL